MRVVVDTNVFISAGLKENSPPETAIHLVAESHLLLKSTITEQELFVTLARPRLMPVGRGTGDFLAEHLFASDRLQLAHLTGFVLGSRRDARVTVNHARIVH